MRLRLLLALSAASLAAQDYHRAGRLTFASPLDNADVPYTFYSPRAVDAARKYPLLIGLHGAGQNERLMMRRVFGRGNLLGESDLEASRVVPPLPDVDFFVACPFARVPNYWNGFLEAEVLALIERLAAEHPIDRSRIYLTGIAEGAGGAIAMALRHPGRFAAVAAVVPIYPDPLHGAMPPARIYQGALDPRVPPQESRDLAARLGAEYIEFPAAKHNAWDLAYARASLFGWLTQTAGPASPVARPLLARLFSARHVYVAGESRRADAETAARWTRTIQLETAGDAEPAAGNAVLFGTKEDNREIARIASRLPLELSPSAADYGLLFGVEIDGRLVAVSSGLPWWQRSAAEPWRAIPAADDFVLFKGTAENIVVRGRFDQQGQIPWDVASQLAAHPAVRALRVAPAPAAPVTRGATGASKPSSRVSPSGRPGSRSSRRPPAKPPSPRPPAKNE